MGKWIWDQESLPFKAVIKSNVKDFLLQNIRKICCGKAKQKDDKNECKEGQTYKAGAFWTPT